MFKDLRLALPMVEELPFDEIRCRELSVCGTALDFVPDSARSVMEVVVV